MLCHYGAKAYFAAVTRIICVDEMKLWKQIHWKLLVLPMAMCLHEGFVKILWSESMWKLHQMG